MSETSVKKPKILLCCTGSVATVKIPEIAIKLSKFAEVRIIVTKHGKLMLQEGVAEGYNKVIFKEFSELNLPIYNDEDEWKDYLHVGTDTVLHIKLTKWADLLIIAPLSANTLAKLANGLCDNLLSCVCRAWQIKTKHFIVAPAMNTFMWDHPLTERHLETIKSFGVKIILPIEKLLACGDVGNGALATVDDIVQNVEMLSVTTTTSSTTTTTSS